MKPLAIDLFCGLGGWTEGLLAEGYQVIGYDIEAHEYGDERYPAQLVVQDVLTLHGAQFKDAAMIVASPPCQEFSYMAMPWSRAKQIARALRGHDDFPEGYKGSRTVAELTVLFDACFRIQREASEAAGHHIPMVVENVKGAQPWVGYAKWSFGSYYLWGDVPALMPHTFKAQKFNPDGATHGQDSWFAVADSNQRGSKNPGFRFDGSGRSFQSESVNRQVAPDEGFKSKGMNWSDRSLRGQDFTRIAGAQVEGMKAPGGAHRLDGAPRTARLTSPSEGRKGAGVGVGAEWFDQNLCSLPSKSPRRKAASAKIAKIPFALSQWIARTYWPLLRARTSALEAGKPPFNFAGGK